MNFGTSLSLSLLVLLNFLTFSSFLIPTSILYCGKQGGTYYKMEVYEENVQDCENTLCINGQVTHCFKSTTIAF